MMEWKLQVPPAASVTIDMPANDAAPAITRDAADKGLWIIRVPAPGLEEVAVTVELPAARKPGTAVPIGPVLGPGAFRKQGTISIFAPDILRPTVSKLRGDLVRREPAGDDLHGPDAVYLYGHRPVPAGAGTAPWLFLDAEKLGGEIRSQTTHTLSLALV